jgi:predicted dehydrogenase
MNVTRRDLLVAGSAMASGGTASAQTAEPARIGIIGCGNRSTAHLAALKHVPESKIVALSDVRPEKSAEANKTLAQAAATYVDYRELIRDRNVGVVVIATPGYLHHEMVLAALRAGKDVLLEKPIATNYADAREIVQEAKRSGRIVAIGIQRRYAAPERQTLAAVESGGIGSVRMITFSEWRGDWIAHGWKYTDPATGKQTNWRYLKKTAGSTELEFSVHALAEVTSLVKSPIRRVAASGGTLHYKDGRDTRDASTILVEFANGVRLSYSFTCFAPRSGSSLSIIGDKGELTRTQNKITLQLAGQRPQELPPEERQPGESAEVLLYRDFLRNIRDRTPSPVGPEEALEPSKIAFAAEWSIAESRFVTERDFA